MNLTRTIGVTIYCYEVNFIVTSKSRALMKQLIVMDQLWHLVRDSAGVGLSFQLCEDEVMKEFVLALKKAK